MLLLRLLLTALLLWIISFVYRKTTLIAIEDLWSYLLIFEQFDLVIILILGLLNIWVSK